MHTDKLINHIVQLKKEYQAIYDDPEFLFDCMLLLNEIDLLEDKLINQAYEGAD